MYLHDFIPHALHNLFLVLAASLTLKDDFVKRIHFEMSFPEKLGSAQFTVLYIRRFHRNLSLRKNKLADVIKKNK